MPNIRTLLLTCALTATLAGCQQPTPGPNLAALKSPNTVNGVGYLVFATVITSQSRDLLITDIGKLIDAGAKEIQIGLNSPGGDIDAAQGIVDYMRREHAAGIDFRMYDIGLVASAATYIFLNAQARYSTQRGAFLFHAASVTSNGPITAEGLRDAADKLDGYERTMVATLKAHTKLTESEALTYVRRTVILNSDDARRDGVIDGIANFTVPKEAVGFAIRPIAKPPQAPTPQPLAINPS